MISRENGKASNPVRPKDHQRQMLCPLEGAEDRVGDGDEEAKEEEKGQDGKDEVGSECIPQTAHACGGTVSP